MLIEFRVGNYRSFNKIQTLSLEATSIREFETDNVANIAPNYKLLKSAVVYGANSSGKSNLLKAMGTMCFLLVSSQYEDVYKVRGISPFLLNITTEKKPSFFEMTFLVKNLRYRYGFEWSKNKVVSEWLFRAKKKVEKPLFIRHKRAIEIFKDFKEGYGLEDKTRENALFLTVSNQFNGEISKSIFGWINNWFILPALAHQDFNFRTRNLLGNKKTKKILTNLYKNLKLGFEDINIVKKTFSIKDIPKNVPEVYLNEVFSDNKPKTMWRYETLHTIYDGNGNPVDTIKFGTNNESEGTEKILNISGVIVHTLTKGGILSIDELDSSLHPILVCNIVKLFNSKKINNKNAQLIFATHDTNLLSSGDFRRDQIYFTEKDRYGATSLYSLVEYKEDDKSIRKDASFEKDYIKGKYGAIPFLQSDTTKLLNNSGYAKEK